MKNYIYNYKGQRVHVMYDNDSCAIELQRIFGDKFTPQVYEFENEEIDVEPF